MNEQDHRLEEYFRKYNALVVNNASLFVEYHTAEDVCQETFIRLGEHIDTIEPESVMKWLLVVSERLAKDILRKGGRYKMDVDPDLDSEIGEEILADMSDPSCILMRKEQCEEKWTVLERLKVKKPKWFDVLHMSYFEEMDNHSIGAELGIKANLVSKWRGRASKWLRDTYEKEYGKRDN